MRMCPSSVVHGPPPAFMDDVNYLLPSTLGTDDSATSPHAKYAWHRWLTPTCAASADIAGPNCDHVVLCMATSDVACHVD